MKDIRFERERFEKALRFYGSKGIVPQTANIRIESEFKLGKGTHRFDVKKDESIARITEKVIRRNDLFLVKSIGVALMIETVGLEGHAPLMTYPLLQSAALPSGLNGFANNHAEVIYNGHLQMKTGSRVNFSRFPLDKFRFVPETQPVKILADATVFESSGIVPQFDHDKLMQMLPEEIVLAGTKDQPIEINYPALSSTDIKGPANTKAFLVLLLDGWLLEGATNEEFKVAENPYSGNI